MKVITGVIGVLAASGALFYAIRLGGKVLLLLLFVGGWRRLFYIVGGCKKLKKGNLLTKFFDKFIGQEKPHTVSKEWEEATNEYLKSQNSNPISGISSEGYKGTGYVVSK